MFLISNYYSNMLRLSFMFTILNGISALPMSTSNATDDSVYRAYTSNNEGNPNIDSLIHYGKVIDLTETTPHEYSKSNVTALIDKYLPKLDSLFSMSRAGNTYILNSTEDLKKKEHSKYMDSKVNQIYFKESKSMVFYNKTDKHWNEYSPPKDFKIKSYELTPVGHCLTCSTKGGCSLNQEYSRGLTIVDNFSFNMDRESFIFIEMTFGFAYSFSSAQSFKYTETYQCNLKNGQVGQMYIEPRYAEMSESSLQRVTFKKFKGLIYKNRYGKRFLKMRVLMSEKPTHHCIVRSIDDNFNCDEPVGEDIKIEFNTPINMNTTTIL